MECTVCNLETGPVENTSKNNFIRLVQKFKSNLKKIKITGAEDLSKIR